VPTRCYLVRGGPGSGKATLGLHFLTAEVEARHHIIAERVDGEWVFAATIEPLAPEGRKP
jgi:KaiC/GvpD/RAD55 family RecA-like ATPase